MQETIKKEDISISYISVLCAYANVAYEIIRHDDDSTDGILRKTIELENNQKFISELRIQLKNNTFSKNTGTVNVKFDKKNVVNSETLCDMLEKKAREGSL